MTVHRTHSARRWLAASLIVAVAFLPALHPATAQDNAGANDPAGLPARMMRQPDISASQIVFVYAGDIWIVARDGGVAHRLTSAPGEESFPRFSPDGSQVAFNASYDGNNEIYVMPAEGGLPQRVTWHPESDRLIGWSPDGEHLIFASRRHYHGRANQLWRIPKGGGLAERIPVPYGESCDFHRDGKRMAYLTWVRDFRTWKRYRGGMAPDIWLYNTETNEAVVVCPGDANESTPMWHGDTLYFVSDRGPMARNNIWAWELNTKEPRQVTHYREMDIHFAAAGPHDIIYEHGGKLMRLPLTGNGHDGDSAAGEPVEVNVRVVDDFADTRPHVVDVSDSVENVTMTPDGKRLIVEARGELFSVPVEHGATFNLTQTSGVAERFPSMCPKQPLVVYYSDASGEYSAVVRELTAAGLPADDGAVISMNGAGFAYVPQWSPDGESAVCIDKAMRILLVTDRGQTITMLDKGLSMYHGALTRFRVSFSADSRYITWSRELDSGQEAVFLYDTAANDGSGANYQLTSGFYNDRDPWFDPERNYLAFLSDRTHSPEYDRITGNWIYPNATNVMIVPLRDDVPSPLLERHDGQPGAAADDDEKEDGETAAGAKNVQVEGFEARAVQLPMDAGNYSNLRFAKGRVLVIRRGRTGAGRGGDTPLVAWDLKERKEVEILDNAGSFECAPGCDSRKLLVSRGNRYAIIEPKPKQKFDAITIGKLEMTVNPREEWRQLVREAWRLQRDYFYDPGMHGVNWQGILDRYLPLVDHCVTRWDVNHVIGELIGELNAGHTYRGGGDTESTPRRSIGLLGCNYELVQGRYRISHIVTGAPWDTERSPLAEPGVDVKVGDYLLAINGTRVSTSREPYAALDGLAGETVLLTVNSQPAMDGAREVAVKPVGSEFGMRYAEWVNGNRMKVEEATGGRVGYVYVPNTGRMGQNELVRQYRGQFGKQAMIIDERWNGGGQIPDRFVELMDRPILNYWAVRDGRDWQTPALSHSGPKCMLINGRAGSGGDAFPHYFRERGLGPLIGGRTWGGLIGYTGVPRLIDGGSVTVPTFGIYSPEGEWIIEGYGVDPDIPVIDDPSKMRDGGDPQLERAIAEMLKALEQNPPRRPDKPVYPDRSGE